VHYTRISQFYLEGSTLPDVHCFNERAVHGTQTNLNGIRKHALYKTAFTVSVDLLGFGCTSGVSAFEVSLSKRELYTFIAKKNTGPRNKKTVVA